MSNTLDELIREHTGRSTRTPSSYKFKQAILAWVNEEVIGEDQPVHLDSYDDPLTSVDELRFYENRLRTEQRAILKHHGFYTTIERLNSDGFKETP